MRVGRCPKSAPRTDRHDLCYFFRGKIRYYDVDTITLSNNAQAQASTGGQVLAAALVSCNRLWHQGMSWRHGGIDGLAGETFSRDAERNNVRTSNLAVGEAWPGLVIFTTMADRQGTAAS